LKDRNKLYIDTKRKALKSELSVGDNVLVKQSQQNDISRSLVSVAGIGVSFNFPSISGIWLSISV
jgi:hypothetical protein